MSELMIAGLLAILIGTFTGILIFIKNEISTRATSEVSADLGRVDIDSSKIPVRGGVGAAIVILLLLSSLLIALPELRLVALLGIVAGVVFGSFLVVWRRRHDDSHAPIALHLVTHPSLRGSHRH